MDKEILYSVIGCLLIIIGFFLKKEWNKNNKPEDIENVNICFSTLTKSINGLSADMKDLIHELSDMKVFNSGEIATIKADLKNLKEDVRDIKKKINI